MLEIYRGGYRKMTVRVPVGLFFTWVSGHAEYTWSVPIEYIWGDNLYEPAVGIQRKRGGVSGTGVGWYGSGVSVY